LLLGGAENSLSVISFRMLDDFRRGLSSGRPFSPADTFKARAASSRSGRSVAAAFASSSAGSAGVGGSQMATSTIPWSA
jgi:hypothetical protein